MTFDKNSNTSTQDFFSNASFGAIDQLCDTAAAAADQQSSAPSTNEFDYRTNNVPIIQNSTTPKDTSNEPAAVAHVSSDVLERVAAIRRNQKPLRRATDISHMVLPRETFSRSLRELELADARFSQEKRATPTPLQSVSFAKLSALDNVVVVDDEKPAGRKNEEEKENLFGECEKNLQCIMDMCSVIESEISGTDDASKKSNLPNNVDNNVEADPVGTGLPSLDEVYKSEMENANLNEMNDFLELEQKNGSKKLQPDQGRRSLPAKLPEDGETLSLDPSDFRKDKKSKKIKLFEELDLAEFLAPKSTPESVEDADDACKTNNERELLATLNVIRISSSSESSETPNVEGKNDGFSTASGKNINISEEKESYYSRLYEELSDVDAEKFLKLKKPKPSGSIPNKQTRDKAVIVFNASKPPHANGKLPEPKLETISEEVPSNGFATASGKGIQISRENENHYLRLYNDLDDADPEKCLLDMKKSRMAKSGVGKQRKDKALIVFNGARPNSTAETLVKPKLEAISEETNGFATARGRGIKISEEKESLYLNIYNDLSDADSLLDVKKSRASKPGAAADRQRRDKAVLVFNKKEPETVKLKPDAASVVLDKPNVELEKKLLSMSSDADEAFYDLGEIEKLLGPPKEHCFTVPDDNTHVPKAKSPELSTSAASNQAALLKRKLDSSGGDVKRQGRCRSFGGFASSDGVTASSKLNKSDPNSDESFANQPLQVGRLSASQCFDPHSDSWLSKMEISHLNSSKLLQSSLPDDAETAQVEFVGFKYAELAESFRRYKSFLRFLEKQEQRCDDNRRDMDISVAVGQTLSISNETTSEQRLSLGFADEVDVRKSMNDPSYYFIEPRPETKPEEVKEPQEQLDRGGGKRRHSDTDSDTPLTTLKKPRVGSELQGRRLFSDESDTEESNAECEETPVKVVPAVEVEEKLTEKEAEELAEKRAGALLLQVRFFFVFVMRNDDGRVEKIFLESSRNP